jgi:hypothetical protein
MRQRLHSKLQLSKLVIVAFAILLDMGGSTTTPFNSLGFPSECKNVTTSKLLFHYPHLEEAFPPITANCAESNLTRIPHGLSSKVTVLEMFGSKYIHSLPDDAFSSVGLVNLNTIDLTDSAIEKIERNAFRNLARLTSLFLHRNRIEILEPEVFVWTVNLVNLRLSENPLKQLSGSFPRLSHIRTVSLHDCMLTSLPDKVFDKLGNLGFLYLGDNRFTHLSGELFSPLIRLRVLDLRKNPWWCDCHLKELRTFVESSGVRSSWGWPVLQELECVGPAQVENKLWIGLSPDNFTCLPTDETNNKTIGNLVNQTKLIERGRTTKIDESDHQKEWLERDGPLGQTRMMWLVVTILCIVIITLSMASPTVSAFRHKYVIPSGSQNMMELHIIASQQSPTTIPKEETDWVTSWTEVDINQHNTEPCKTTEETWNTFE